MQESDQIPLQSILVLSSSHCKQVSAQYKLEVLSQTIDTRPAWGIDRDLRRLGSVREGTR